MNNRSTPGNHYPALDGLRGIAILLVVIYHNFGFIDYFFFGWLGVDLFFVLSGFLITDILLSTAGKPNWLRNFYMRRILRIFPLYYLALLIFLVVVPRFELLPGLSYYTDHQVWLWTYLQNWLFIFDDAGNINTLHHLWSLAVEEQFYLVWPLIILLVRKPRYLLILMCLALVAVLLLRLWIWRYDVSQLSYYKLYTFTRIDGLCIGSIVALIYRIQPGFLRKFKAAIVLSFALLNILFFLFNRQYGFSFPYLALIGYTTFAMIFGIVVYDSVTRETKWLNYLLELRILRFFGKISYGLYVFHWPLYLLAAPWLGRQLSDWNSPWLPFFVSLLASLLAILISWLSFISFERYFLRLKKHYQ